MAKYTDEQIKKALEKCKNGDCRDCLIVNECCPSMNSPIFDLINRQEAEIERLKEKNRLACQCTPKAIRRARAEAIKEFAERLCDGRCENDPVVIAAKCLVKEMVGEGE